MQVNKCRTLYLLIASIINHIYVMKKIINRSSCPVSFSLDYLGDKWVLLILRDLIFSDKSTYGDFLTSEEKIATNILADRLKLLQENGFIESTVSPEKKNKFIYNLTDKGIDLIPVVLELMVWGSKYNPPGAAALVKAFNADREATIQQYKDRAKTRRENAKITE